MGACVPVSAWRRRRQRWLRVSIDGLPGHGYDRRVGARHTAVLQLDPGAAGLGSLRRRYSKPLYLLLLMVGLILAIACANIAISAGQSRARRGEMAIRLSLGADGSAWCGSC